MRPQTRSRPRASQRLSSEPRLARLLVMTKDAWALAADYVDVLGATLIDHSDLDPEFGDLLGIGPARGRAVGLAFGEQLVDLIELTPPTGRRYPDERAVHDLAFQHFALRVTDIQAAHARLSSSSRFTSISRSGPVRLPDAAGGVTAFKFRDVEGHPLELLEFPSHVPAQGGEPREGRHLGTGQNPGVAGIDHTAMSVSDTGRTTRFFAELLNFTPVGQSHNRGREQELLDGLPSPEVDVTALRAGPSGPGVELLQYHGVAHRVPDEVAANDVAATHTVFSRDSVGEVLDALNGSAWRGHARTVVTGADGRQVLAVRDPDGHRLIIEETG